MLIAIPNWAKHIVIEFDGSIWANRYHPSKNLGNNSNNTPTKYNNNVEQSALLAKGGEPVMQIVLDMPDELNGTQMFIREDFTIVDSNNTPYKEVVLEAFLDKYHTDKETAT